MKNSPEKNEFRELENRLRNYSESPDAGIWGKIQNGIGQGDRVGVAAWKIGTAIGVAVFLLTLGIYFGYEQWNAASSSTKNTQQASTDKSFGAQGAGVVPNDTTKRMVNAKKDKSTDQPSSSTIGQSINETDNAQGLKPDQQTNSPKTNQRNDESGNASAIQFIKESGNKSTETAKSQLPSHTSAKKEMISPSVNEDITALRSAASKDIRRGNLSPDAIDTGSTQTVETPKAEQSPASFNAASSLSKDNIASIGSSETSTIPNTNTPELKTSAPISDSTLVEKPKDAKKQAAQKREISKSKKLPVHKVFTIYGSLTPSLSFLSVTPHAHDNVSVKQFQNPSIFSTDRIGFSFDAGIQGLINSRLSYIAGLSFYHQSQSLHYGEVGQGPNNVSGDYNDFNYTINPSNVDHSMRYTMTNGGLQAGLLYTLKDNPHLTHRIGLLLQYQKGLSHSTGDYSNAGSQYLNYQIVYRVEFPIKPKLKFMFQPMFVSPIMTNESLHAPFDLKQFKAGIGFGFVYQLSSGGDVSGIHYKGQ